MQKPLSPEVKEPGKKGEKPRPPFDRGRKAYSASKATGDPPIAGASLPRYALHGESPVKACLLIALPLDPTSIFVFWELPAKEKPVLRLLDLSRGKVYSEFAVSKPSGSLYLRVRPGGRYMVEACSKGPNGKYITIGMSKEIAVPRKSPPKGKAAIPEKYFRYHPTSGSRS